MWTQFDLSVIGGAGIESLWGIRLGEVGRNKNNGKTQIGHVMN